MEEDRVDVLDEDDTAILCRRKDFWENSSARVCMAFSMIHEEYEHEQEHETRREDPKASTLYSQGGKRIAVVQ